MSGAVGMAEASGGPVPPRTRAIVDLAAICQNYRRLAALAGPSVELMCVVKADAYGHGAGEVSRALFDAGARHFAVATLDEAVGLAEAGLESPVAVLFGLAAGEEREAAARAVRPMINSLGQLERWEREARRLGRRLPCHLMFNTGLNRLGLDLHGGSAGLERVDESSNWLDFEGVATHYAAPENFASGQTGEQAGAFRRVVRTLRERGVAPRHMHTAASAAIVHRRTDDRVRADCTMARPGLALYGYVLRAVGRDGAPTAGLRPALEWRARLSGLHDVARGAAVGYSASFVAPRDMRVGVLSVGFADGLDRRLANRGCALLRGVPCPIVGAISMDLTVIDVTAARGAAESDECVVLGRQWQTAQGISDLIGGVPYEVLCGISPRVPRQYVQTGVPERQS